MTRKVAAVRWQGERLEGKSVLIHAEQGLGDTLQFVRYLRFAKQAGGSVVFRCPAPLRALLQGLPDADLLVVAGDELPHFHVHAPLLSLPYILGTSLDSIPCEVPYLVPDAKLVRFWGERLDALAGVKIGICWQGNPKHGRARFRCPPPEHLQALAQTANVKLINLEKAPIKRTSRASDPAVIDFSDEIDEESAPFMDIAAIIRNVDLVISCDTAIAHLAGAMSVPVWLVLDYAADWRWLQDREDSPWYPTMRLFRQTQPGDWDDVFGRVVQALQSLVSCGQDDL